MKRKGSTVSAAAVSAHSGGLLPPRPRKTVITQLPARICKWRRSGHEKKKKPEDPEEEENAILGARRIQE
jgi:hypothetical protein